MLSLVDKYFFTIPIIYRALISLGVILIIALLAYKLKQLTISGAIAATIMGFTTLFLSGTSALMLYLFFFISAAFISKSSKRVRGVEKIHKKGATRDYKQVLANGLLPLISIVLYRITTNGVFLLTFSATLAEACADTWGGDIGILSKEPPVSILTFTRVERGLSGGISMLGCSSSLLACILYGIFYYSTFNSTLSGALLVAAAGFSGCLIDSILGASIQVHYIDEDTGKLTEKEKDEKGNKRRVVRGIKYFDNDMVNFTSGVFSFLLSLSLGLFLHI